MCLNTEPTPKYTTDRPNLTPNAVILGKSPILLTCLETAKRGYVQTLRMESPHRYYPEQPQVARMKEGSKSTDRS